jgi:uncharacterized membrane protein YwzB
MVIVASVIVAANLVIPSIFPVLWAKQVLRYQLYLKNMKVINVLICVVVEAMTIKRKINSIPLFTH